MDPNHARTLWHKKIIGAPCFLRSTFLLPWWPSYKRTVDKRGLLIFGKEAAETFSLRNTEAWILFIAYLWVRKFMQLLSVCLARLLIPVRPKLQHLVLIDCGFMHLLPFIIKHGFATDIWWWTWLKISEELTKSKCFVWAVQVRQYHGPSDKIVEGQLHMPKHEPGFSKCSEAANFIN